MISYNVPRPKYGLVSVIIHKEGYNYSPYE